MHGLRANIEVILCLRSLQGTYTYKRKAIKLKNSSDVYDILLFLEFCCFFSRKSIMLTSRLTEEGNIRIHNFFLNRELDKNYSPFIEFNLTIECLVSIGVDFTNDFMKKSSLNKL